MDTHLMTDYINSKAQTKDDKEKQKLFRILAHEIKLKNKHIIMKHAYKKYIIIKFRQKISFLAFKNKQTIVELFMSAIMKSHGQMVFEGYLKQNEKQVKM